MDDANINTKRFEEKSTLKITRWLNRYYYENCSHDHQYFLYTASIIILLNS